MQKYRHLISGLIVVAILAVLVISFYANASGNPHGEDWLAKHGETVMRNRNPEKNCLKCHGKKLGHTKENFCDKCHQQAGVKVNWPQPQ